MFTRFLAVIAGVTVSASAADSVLVFNELQYHPANELTQTEWVELRSLQAVDVDISGWRIDGGISYTFPAGTIVPGGAYIVVAAAPVQIPGSLGPFTGQLDNGGATLRLHNLNGRIMDELTYGDSGDWPRGADGSGATLSRRSGTAASGASQWATSTQLGGSPGAQNFPNYGLPITNTVIGAGTTWKYRDTAAGPPGNWAGNAFDDSLWAQGQAPLGTRSPGPLSVTANLVERFRASDITGLQDGALISSWNDTANGPGFGDRISQNASPSLSTDAPSLKLNATATGKAAVRFSANTQELRTSAPPTIGNTSGWVYFVVLRANGAQASGDPTDGDGSYILDRTSATTPLASLKVTNGRFAVQKRYDSDADLGGPVSTTALSQTDFQIVAMRRKRSTLQFELWVNGVLEGTTPDSGAPITVPALNIGHHATAGTPQGFIGDIAEVLVYNHELSAADFNAVGTYLESEYGIDSAFPGVSAPTLFSAAAPTVYLRNSFTYAGNPAETVLRLTHTVADGAVFYLNGIELTRFNMPAGAVPHGTPARSVISNPTTSTAELPAASLVRGTNVFAVSLHKASGSASAVFNAALETVETPMPPTPYLRFSEFGGAGLPGFYIELQNATASAVSASGWSITSSTGQTVALPPQNIPAGAYLLLNTTHLGFLPAAGTRLNLIGPGGTTLRDSREVTERVRGLTTGGDWGFATTPTPGAPNSIATNTAIVINEIFYHAPDPSPPALPSGEQWIELFNRSKSPVDVSGWAFTEGIKFTFPAQTPPVPPGGYIVVAWNPRTFASLHPGVTALGPWSGTLRRSGETIRLADNNGNVADEVRYHDGGRWSQSADGGGSSLELMDPDSDNSVGEAWDGSDESSRSTWQTVSITGQATNIPSNNPATWNEFVFGLLDKGEMLIDDISVRNVTQGNVELIQNGSFSSGSARFWRIIGTHSGTVVPDPTAPANKVLKVTATAETEHMHNHATTTLKTGGTFHSIVDTDTYRITFRAKWLRGSNALHSRLYTNRLPLKTLLNRPTTGGTPGTRNSRFTANSGPTFNSLSHSPPVPSALRNATVSVRVADPDGVSSVQLFTSVNGAAFSSTPMTLGGNGLFTGTIPGQAAGTVAQFYVRATDLLGATSFFPARGAASRAMVQWDDGRALLTLPSGARPHNVRVILPPADASTLYRQENLMSNAAFPCTVILDERDIYYRAGVSLKSSEHGRFNIERVGYNLEFPPDDLFMGTHGGISIDRSGGIASGQSEILLKTLNVLAGGIHAPQDDLVRIIPACAPNAAGIAFDGSGMLGAAILSKTRLKGDYLDNQWDNGSNGMMFKYERIYELTQTIDPATRIVDPEIVPEHPKIPQDYTSPPGVDVANLGANPEFYRWHWLVESGRRTDDYSGIMNVTNAIGQAPGATFDALVDQYVDVDAWLRGHVGPVLFGTVDNYLAPDGRGSQHNVLFYFPPGKKAVVFPWDCDYLDQGNPGATLIGGDIAKFIENPAWKRLYFGHMLDVLNRSFNATTMSQWATHYSKFGTEDMLGMVSSYLIPRTNYARDVILGQNGQTAPVPRVAFERTSASPVTTSGSFTTVTGNAWIDLHEIRLQGATRPLPVTWTGESTWSLPLPLDPGTHTYTLVAYNKTGESLGTTTVTVSTISEVFPATANSLIVSELHYNPPGPDDTTEFIELQNITASTLDLSGCHFDEENGQGISYTFPNGVHLAPDARILIAKDRVAFLTAYPSVPTAQVAPGGFGPSGLDNNGERIKFYSAAGTLIFDFTYQDNLSRTDGGGRSLVRVVSSSNPNPLEYTWRASITHGGNPGGTDTLPFSGTITRDADGDGIAELLEYALGTSDSVSNPAPLAVTREVSGTLIAVFTRCANADAAVLSIEAVTDLKTPWAPANAVKTGDTLSGSFLTETWRITPPNGAANTFLRLKASLR